MVQEGSALTQEIRLRIEVEVGMQRIGAYGYVEKVSAAQRYTKNIMSISDASVGCGDRFPFLNSDASWVQQVAIDGAFDASTIQAKKY